MKLSKANQYLLDAHSTGYRIDKQGNIISPFNGIINGCIQQEYKQFCFNDSNKKSQNIKVHRMLAYQKYGMDLFEEGIEVRHLDGDSLNNSWDNIAIGTHQENMMDIPKEIRKKSSLKASTAAAKKNRRFTDLEMKEIRDYHNHGYTYFETMKKYNISSSGMLWNILKKNM